MPISRTHVRLAVGTAAVVTAGAVVWRIDKKRKEKRALASKKSAAARLAAEKEKVAQADLKCLRENYLQPKAALAEQIYDSLSYARRYFDPGKLIGLNGRTQARVFDTAVQYAKEGDTGDREDLEPSVRRLLRQALPNCEWDRQAWPPEPGSDWETAYNGVSELFQLAVFEMRYGNFHMLPNGGGAGIVCPGWRQTPPAPTSTLRPFDYVELLIGTERSNGEPVREEWVNAMVTATSGDNLTVMLLEGGEPLPDGSRAKGPMYSDDHGYQANSTFTIPRRCVFKIIKK